jgi:hypothetical protein
VYFLINELDYNDLFDYLSNETYTQVEQKNNHLGQNEQWVLITWSKWPMDFNQV